MSETQRSLPTVHCAPFLALFFPLSLSLLLPSERRAEKDSFCDPLKENKMADDWEDWEDEGLEPALPGVKAVAAAKAPAAAADKVSILSIEPNAFLLSQKKIVRSHIEKRATSRFGPKENEA